MKKNIWLLLLLLLSSACVGFAQQHLAPNVRHYLHNELGRATRSVGKTTLLRAYLYVEDTFSVDKLRELGVSVNLSLKNLYTVTFRADQLQQLVALQGIKYIQLAESVHPQLDKARAATGVDRVHGDLLGERGYTGKGVVIGVIDAGFDYTHPSFLAADGKTLRIQRVWEQDYKEGTPPEGFSYGAEFATSEAILAAAGDVSTNSHGTHVAGIAAGGYRGNDWCGVAPDADIVLVSMSNDSVHSAENVNVSDAIAYIFSYADQVGKPCVINMSLGTQIGPHDGSSLFDAMANQLQGKGRVLVGSVGNFGNAKIHVGRSFTAGEEAPLQTFIDFNEKPDAKSPQAKVDVWGSVGMSFDVQLVVYNYKSGTTVQSSEVVSANQLDGNDYTMELTKSAKGSVSISTEVNPLNNKPHAAITLSVTSLRSGYALGLQLIPHSEGSIHAWADNTHVKFTNNERDDWQDGDTKYTLAEIGGTAEGILSVGAYTTRDVYTETGSTEQKSTGETLGQTATFSSRGPAIDGRMKPDVSAPGTYIISSMSSHYAALSSHPLAGMLTWDGVDYPYGYMQGTSMAAPFMTGVVATWLQAAPELDVVTLREVLKQTAMHDEFTEVSGNATNLWGYGKIDAAAGLQYIQSVVDIASVANAAQPMVAIKDNVLCLKWAETVSASAQVNVFSLNGTLIEHHVLPPYTIGSVQNISLNHLTSGVYLIKVVTPNGNYTYRVVVVH